MASPLTYSIASSLDAKRAYRTGAAYPPLSAIGSAGALTVRRKLQSAVFEISVGVARWLAALPVGATRTNLKIRFTPSSITDADTRNLVWDWYSGAVSSGAYQEAGSDGAGSVPLASLTNGVAYETDLANYIGNAPSNNYMTLRFWIDGDEPAGNNEVTLGTVQIIDYFTLTLAPVHVALDGDESSGDYFNRTLTHDLTFQHQDGNTPPLAMAAFQIRYKRQSDVSYTTIPVSSSSPFYQFAANTFTSGADNTWVLNIRSKSIGQADYGAWSAPFSFIATANIATPVVTAPSGVISVANPTITATSSESTRTAYQARVRRQSDGAVLYDSLEVAGTGLSQAVSTNLTDGAYYADFRVKVDGAWSSYDSEAFTVVLVPPTAPTLAATPVDEQGAINLTYTSDNDTELFVSEDYSPVDESGIWTSIAAGLGAAPAGALYQWFEAGSNKELNFKAVTSLNGATAESEVQQATLNLTGIWIHRMSDPAGSVMQFGAWVDSSGSGTNWQSKTVPEVSLHYLAGRSTPVVNRGEHITRTMSFAILLITDGGELDEDWQGARDLLEAPERLCVRTMEKNIVAIGSVLSVDGPNHISTLMNTYMVSFEMVVTG